MKNITEQIERLISGFLQKEISGSEIDVLLKWLQESEDNRLYFKEINEAYHATITMGRFNHEKIDKAWNKLSSRIDLDVRGRSRTTIVKRFYYNFFRMAAVLSALAMISYFVIQYYLDEAEEEKNTTVYNTELRKMHMQLPDSTTVWLNANSTLKYAHTFGKGMREVFLKGEAYFDVRKDSQDFVVNTEKLSIYVKGTKFNVRAYIDEKDVETTLGEGKVELKLKGHNSVYVMEPGDQITFNSAQKQVTINEVDPSDYSAWKEERLVFDNTPLSEIIQKLENRYRVRIIVEDSLAARERITMTIEQEPIGEVMDFIRLSSRLKYSREHSQITIYE